MSEQSKTIFSDSYSIYSGDKQKRKKARVKLDLPCEVKLMSGKGAIVNGRLSDLGTGGLSLLSNLSFYTGDRVKTDFTLGKEKVEIQGSIHRTSGKQATVIFSDIPNEILNTIQEFIHKHYFKPEVKY